jgi:enoyl-CoA hydratase/carnithine racemase
MDEKAVLVERRGRVGVVTLNRPAKLNALNRQLIDQLEQALAELDADDEIGAIVITGAGERAFSAGGDMAEQIADADTDRPSRQGATTRIVRECRTPTLAAIRGYCFGGGALLAISCDIRIASADARLKFPGATYGRAPGGATLPRIVGDAKAKELLLTADEVGADEALRIGLVNQVVAPAELLEYAVAMGERIAGNSPMAVRAIKETIDLALPIEHALEHEAEANRGLSGSSDSAARFRRAAERVVGR